MREHLAGHRRSQGRAIACVVLIAVGGLPAAGTAEEITFPAVGSMLIRDVSFIEFPRSFELIVRGSDHLRNVIAGDALGQVEFHRPTAHGPLDAGDRFDVSMGVRWTDGFMADHIRDCCREPFPIIHSSFYTTSGALTITGGEAVLEYLGGEIRENLNGSAPFEFSGVIDAADRETGARLFRLHLSGAGTAHMRLALDANHQVQAYLQDYEIGVLVSRMTEPIPEPATMVLVGLGAAGLAARRRLSRLDPPRSRGACC